MPRPPIIPLKTIPGTNGGEWDSPRTTKGGCGVGTPPCQHYGYDAIGQGGTNVAAPCNGWVLVSEPVKGPPFSGYGPAVVLFAHDDQGNNDRGFLSTRYTLLAHLDPATLKFDLPYKNVAKLLEQTFGLKGSTKLEDAEWAQLDDGTIAKVGKVPDVIGFGDDRTWSGAAGVVLPYVQEGTILGSTENTMNHTHWEVRIAPLASPKISKPDGTLTDGRIDPLGWLAAVDPLGEWTQNSGSTIRADAKPRTKNNSIGWLLLLGGMFVAFGKKKRRGR